MRVGDGVAVAVHELAGPNDGRTPVLLFSHATGFHGRSFGPMASELSGTYRCLAIDHRGHGLSALTRGASLAWTAMGDDLAAVLASGLIGAEQAVHGVGHSMGGAVLALAAHRCPGRIRSLWLYEPVIVPPGALPSASEPNPMAEAALRRRSTFETFGDAKANYAAKAPLNQLAPDALEAYVRGGFVQRSDGSVQLLCDPATEAQVFRGAVDSGVFEVVASLDVPTAIVTGRAESNAPSSFAPAVVAEWPSAVLVEQRHLGHFGPLEDPPAMARQLDSWVQSHS